MTSRKASPLKNSVVTTHNKSYKTALAGAFLTKEKIRVYKKTLED